MITVLNIILPRFLISNKFTKMRGMNHHENFFVNRSNFRLFGCCFGGLWGAHFRGINFRCSAECLGESCQVPNVSHSANYYSRPVVSENPFKQFSLVWMVIYPWDDIVRRQFIFLFNDWCALFGDDYSFWWSDLFDWLGRFRLRID